LDNVSSAALLFTVYGIVKFVLERAIKVPQLNEFLYTFVYLELSGFNNWLPYTRKFKKDPIIAIKYDDMIKIRLPFISSLTNVYISVPFVVSNYTLDKLADKINAVVLNHMSPDDFLNSD
jgi:hypothetical protein